MIINRTATASTINVSGLEIEVVDISSSTEIGVRAPRWADVQRREVTIRLNGRRAVEAARVVGGKTGGAYVEDKTICPSPWEFSIANYAKAIERKLVDVS